MTPIGNYIVHRRKGKGWTRAELARASGVPYTTLRHIEQGKVSKKPEEHTIRALADALENDADVMLALAGYGPLPKRTHDQVIVELTALGDEAPKWKLAIERALAEMTPDDLQTALNVLQTQVAAARRRRGRQ